MSAYAINAQIVHSGTSYGYLALAPGVIPVLHGVTFNELNDVSPMLASHTGLNTQDSSLDDVAGKIAAAAAALPAA
ncbi:MAG TPA: hypothetical protein VF542_03285 [Jatrophihabitans sp.]